jgi:biotin carboxylase
MQNILVIAPTGRERRDLPSIAAELELNLIWDDFAGDYFDDFLEHDASSESLDIVQLIEDTIARYKDQNIRGVTSAVGYPGMSVVAVMCQRLGLSGPIPETIMLCEHKYLSRKAQQEIVPEATPWFALIDPARPDSVRNVKRFPVFIKPVKSCMSMNAYRIDSQTELFERVRNALHPVRFYKPFDDMVRAYTELGMGSGYLLAEELLTGHQVSVEGYVADGQPVIQGIIDAVMFPGTISFKRFQYPSQLPPEVQSRMESIACRFLREIHYDNAMFNMELIWNEETDRISIIEVNPKIASQFPDLFEKVDGTSSYRTMLQIAAGMKPEFVHGQGKFKVAGSCVLRIFEDKKVVRKPTPEHVEAVRRIYPDALINIIATEGKYLSEQLQDTASYRYGLVNIGAQSMEELEEKFEHIKSMLPFEFAPRSLQRPTA